MKKLKLNIDKLKVESFLAGPSPVTRLGTVKGQESALNCDLTTTYTECDDQTCVTCATCAGITCVKPDTCYRCP